MFEKEAEEYIDKLTKDWSDGEYSFSVEELRQAILHFSEFGYNKANEWHKVEDVLPPMDEIVYLWDGNERFPVCAYRHIPYSKTENDWVWECYWGSGYTLTQSVAKNYLWKEMMLPKECL